MIKSNGQTLINLGGYKDVEIHLYPEFLFAGKTKCVLVPYILAGENMDVDVQLDTIVLNDIDKSIFDTEDGNLYDMMIERLESYSIGILSAENPETIYEVEPVVESKPFAKEMAEKLRIAEENIKFAEKQYYGKTSKRFNTIGSIRLYKSNDT